MKLDLIKKTTPADGTWYLIQLDGKTIGVKSDEGEAQFIFDEAEMMLKTTGSIEKIETIKSLNIKRDVTIR